MEHDALAGVLTLLVLSVLAVATLRHLHLPPILGYLLVGVAAGPHALGWIPESAVIELLAEIGVVFLLFTIGLEFSVPRLLAMRRAVLGVGGAQVALFALLGGCIAWLLGIGWQSALVVGGALAMSSTAIAVKQLAEQMEMQSPHGRLALGILLFQDIAVVPFLVVIPILAAGQPVRDLAMPLVMASAKGLGAFLTMFAVGHWLLRPLFHWVAALRSAELFTLTALLVSLAAAWVTFTLGLSLALGAFLAGMMLGETEYRHQIETDIRPFRDVLMGLFFIAVGFQLDLTVLPSIWMSVVFLAIVLVFGKGSLIALLARAGGYATDVSLRAGTALAQGGEFGFALLAVALAHGLLDIGEAQPVLAAIVLSMAVAPLLIRYNSSLASRLCEGGFGGGRRSQDRQFEKVAAEAEGHVIICGFGRIGQNLAGFLTEEGFDYVALDLDSRLIREAWEAGERVFYGDSTHAEILETAGLARARALVVTFDDAHTAEKIIRAARKSRSDLPIVVRTRDDTDLETLENRGATEVVPENVESSMMLAVHLLQRLGVPMEEVLHLVERARQEHYRRLRTCFHGEEIESVEEAAHRHRLHTVVLPPESHAVGATLGALGLEAMQVSVNAIRRGAIRGEDPSPEMVLQAGDAVVLMGPADALEHAEERILSG